MDKLILLLLISTAFVVAQAKVVLPSYITDNMVVQRNSVMKITGHASSGSKVNVIAGWDSRSREVKADSEGKFDISLDTPDAGGPYSIIIADKDSKVKVGNVLSGELWLCSGQSNMEFPVEGWTSVMDADHVVSTARNPDIRLLQVKKRVAFSPQDDIETNMGGWVEAAPNTMDFSAIAYLYAKELRDSLKVPVGLLMPHGVALLPRRGHRMAFSKEFPVLRENSPRWRVAGLTLRVSGRIMRRRWGYG